MRRFPPKKASLLKQDSRRISAPVEQCIGLLYNIKKQEERGYS